MRLQPDGLVDSKFELFPGVLYPGKVLVDAHDRIVVAGQFSDSAGVTTEVRRLRANGTLDASFGPFQFPIQGPEAMWIAPDGAILLGGDTVLLNGGSFKGVARLVPDGGLDPTFTRPELQGAVSAIVGQSDRKVLAFGRFIENEHRLIRRVVRLQADGRLDPEFPMSALDVGSISVDEYGQSQGNVTVNAMALQSDGHLILAGDFGGVDGVRRPNIVKIFTHSPSLAIDPRSGEGGGARLLWDAGVLETALSLDGPWEIVSGARSPLSYGIIARQQYFRLRFN